VARTQIYHPQVMVLTQAVNDSTLPSVC